MDKKLIADLDFLVELFKNHCSYNIEPNEYMSTIEIPTSEMDEFMTIIDRIEEMLK